MFELKNEIREFSRDIQDLGLGDIGVQGMSLQFWEQLLRI